MNSRHIVHYILLQKGTNNDGGETGVHLNEVVLRYHLLKSQMPP